MMKVTVALLAIVASFAAHALSPVSVDSFYKSIDQSTNVQLGEWSGRGDLCMQKAKETGYLMLWFLTAIKNGSDCKQFLKTNLCRSEFCNLINNYKYIILCCEDYGDSAVRSRKDALYGFKSGGQIYDEATGKYVRNWNGYPIKTDNNGIINYCDPPPSLHLLKFDTSGSIIFHVCGYAGKYDTKFSPYASKFPIPNGMNKTEDKFAPWLKQYLDMYPATKQITEYENAGGDAQSKTEAVVGTNYIYEVVDIFITETINPTVYQIALHRDNVLFRSITTMGDIMVKDRIYDNFTTFDSKTEARNWKGKWFVNHDSTVSALSSEVDSGASLDILAKEDCILEVNQRFGNGFSIEGYTMSAVTNIVAEPTMSAIGTMITLTTTNVTVETSSSPFLSLHVKRNDNFEGGMMKGCLYRISVDGNSTFDVLSTK